MILHLKPKVVNVLAKTWFIRANLQQKMFNFSSDFSFIKITLQTHASRMPNLTFSANMLLLNKVKQVFKLIKDKKVGATLLANISL